MNYLECENLFGHFLIKENIATYDQIKKAIKVQEETDELLSSILIKREYVNQIDLYKTLADRSIYFDTELTTVNLNNIKNEIDYDLISNFNAPLLLNKLFLPIYLENDIIKIIVKNFKDKSIDKYLKDKLGDVLIEKVEASESELRYLIEFAFKDQILDNIENNYKRDISDSAINLFTKSQLIVLGLVSILILTGLFLFNKMTINVLTYGINTIFFFLITFSFINYIVKRHINSSDNLNNENNLKEERLPSYTVLVPVLRDNKRLDDLLLSLKKINYPQEKMEVIFLFSYDIKDKLKQLSDTDLQENWKLFLVPREKSQNESQLKNFGLQFVKSKYFTVLSTDDVPEVDQLIRAAFKFELSDNLACLYAPVKYISSKDSLFNKYIDIENNLSFLNLSYFSPSNIHYKTSTIKRIGGWDNYNLASNFELLLKVKKLGDKVAKLNSHTYRKSGLKFNRWFNHFINKTKGYIQTFLVINRKFLKKLKSNKKYFLVNNILTASEIFVPLIFGILSLTIFLKVVFMNQIDNFTVFSIFNIALFFLFNIYYILSTNLDIKVSNKLAILSLIFVHLFIKSYGVLKSILLTLKNPHKKYLISKEENEEDILFMQINFTEKLKDI